MKLLNCGKINTSFEHESPADFLTSQWQERDRSSVYLVYRWSIACFFVFSFVVSVITAVIRSELLVYLIYLTHWNLIFTTASMVLSAVLVTRYNKNQLNCDKMTKEMKILWFLSSSSYMYAFLISLIYWTLLFNKEKAVMDLNNVLVHMTNSLTLLIDLAVVKQPSRFGIFIFPLGCGIVYLFFSWLYPALGGLNR